ncbi:MAG: ComF family protein, partial [Chitinophagaceae bacterium]
MTYSCAMFWHDLSRIILDTLFPRLCSGCSEPLQRKEFCLCLSCYVRLPRTGFVCGTNNPAERLFQGRIVLESATAFLFFRKAGLSQRLMHGLKYKGDEALGMELGRHFGRYLKNTKGIALPEALTCVPLHRDKMKKRGFNQSAAIGRGMSEVLEIPLLEDLLTRPEHSETQTRKKRYERWENMQSGFVAAYTGELKHVGIVDDVITTGATLEACASVLKSQGNLKI